MFTYSKLFHRIMLGVLPLLASILACSTFAPPTATPVPTATFTPTFTSTFTPTATNTPTRVPTATATPDYQATQDAEYQQVALDIMAKLKLPTDTGKLGWYQTKMAGIALEGPQARFFRIDGFPNTSDFVLYTELTWNTDSWPVCGVMFRADDRWAKGDYYLAQFLRLSGAPSWDIEYYKNGEQAGIPSEKVRFSSFLKIDSGAKNVIVMSALGNEFKMYINGNFEGRYYDYDTKLTQGNFGYIGWQNSGKTECIFNNTWIWVYK